MSFLQLSSVSLLLAAFSSLLFLFFASPSLLVQVFFSFSLMMARHSALVSTRAPVMARVEDEATGGFAFTAVVICKYLFTGLTRRHV